MEHFTEYPPRAPPPSIFATQSPPSLLSMATNITPYKVSIPATEVEKLNQKLMATRFAKETENNNWSCGPPIGEIRRIATHWREAFNWSTFEEKLNKLPNFETTISLDGFEPFQLHFLHQRSSVPDAIPLLFIHGWPGSFYEVTKLLSLVIARGLPFHIVAPSLPNFGFSSGVDKPGFGMRQYAETCHKLMLGLGYEQYAGQGGDWGSSISRLMGSLYPQSLRALHLNLIVATPPPATAPLSFARFLITHLLNRYTPEEAAGLQKAQSFQGDGNAYFEIQKQRPQTIGMALEDSPVGLLTWMFDKMKSWTDDYSWTDDEICEWVSLYWFSRAGPAASVRIYHEAFKGEFVADASLFTQGTKMGFSYFPKEMFRTPSFWNKQLGDVVFEREHERGGHFAAWEQPEALADDLCEMFQHDGLAYKSVMHQ
ncbi:Alpha/Beta hydrolase protein [Nemania abortiva]|nr:Alpha/Beta hydrolase protein [Nemania abortiva]